MTCKTIFGAIAACLTFTAAATANVEYDCGEYNNAIYSITYFDEEDVAEIRAVDLAGQMASALMRPAISGSGSRYVSDTGNSEFIEHQGNAYLFVQGVQLTCTVFAVTAPGDNGGGFAAVPLNIPAYSYGGNLRSGPGMQFGTLGSLPEGTTITIIEETGIYMGDHQWFGVRLFNGQTAYHWGGIICASGAPLNGVFTGC
ncbi:SH3 domain-containing protein [Jannaschia sp. CCS1]|uniref:SH3 domain-containing protein n=1 Tax=Jannaschia sp. (strain CCS1) TaxID=290400 RepID=UPI000053AD8E|nr:SH3 domain-containing protein [Jannaschia sp. CCS1]ABD54430.1 hypothetical protein Jann_1513 [Jannaschia sp. CCS1]